MKCELIQPALAILVTLGFFAITAYLLRFGTPATGGETVLVFLGNLGTAWSMTIAYYFGTTQGSKRKDETIATMATSQPPPTVNPPTNP